MSCLAGAHCGSNVGGKFLGVISDLQVLLVSPRRTMKSSMLRASLKVLRFTLILRIPRAAFGQSLTLPLYLWAVVT